MPIDETDLENTLVAMKRIYMEDPKVAVRSQKMIMELHNFCIRELKRFGIKGKMISIKSEPTVYGSHKPKNVDVAVIHEEAGPLIAISIRSQMSSVDKNFINYYEGIIGDVISLHDKYPELVIGELYMLPKETIIEDEKGERRLEKHDLVKKEALFKRITGRKDTKERSDKYEHLAFLAVDFVNDPPIVLDIPTDPTLRIENFFDKLLETYKERNPFLNIIEIPKTPKTKDKNYYS